MTAADAAANPFPGLRPFREDEEHLFFGRESQVDAMIDKLAATRFLAVLGTSGSGKSSLVNCGLRPALHRGSMARVGTAWRMAQLRPGGDPIRALAEALAAPGVLFTQPPSPMAALPSLIDTTLRLSRLGLIDIVEQARLPEGVALLVIVDQFEELFRYSRLATAATADDVDEAVAFTNLLLQASEHPEVPIHVVLTMRSDFLGDCTRLPGLAEAINAGQYLVPRMTRDERRSAVAGPVGVGGAAISPVLLTRLVNDVGDNPDQLSILQHALNRTWAEWQEASGGVGPIEPRHYEAIGTMAEALDRHAEAAFAELESPRARSLCERVFRALTDQANDPRGVRRPARFALLCLLAGATPAEVAQVVDVFREPGRAFLMPPVGEPLQPETVVDISHESLMRVWRRLQRWAAEEAQSAQQYRRIAQAAALHAQRSSSLWRDPELQLALDWRERQRPTLEWAALYGGGLDAVLCFLDASAAEREAHRQAARRARVRRRWTFAGAFFTVAGVGVVFFALWRNAQLALRETIVGKTVLQSRAMLDGQSLAGMDKALLVSAAGHRLGADKATYGGLQYALQQTTRLHRVVALVDPVVAFSPDRRLAVSVHENVLQLWDTATAEPVGAPLQGHTATVNAAAFSPDGSTLASVSDDATLRLWDTRSGEPRGAPLIGHGDRVWAVAFSPDGRTLASGGEDATLRLWDVASGQARGAPLIGHGNRVWAVAFSPDGGSVVSASDDMTLRRWDVATGNPRSAPLTGHSGVVSAVAYSPDGSRLVSGGGDDSLRLWDARTGEPIGAPLLGHGSRIWSVAFSPDGKTLASGSEDQTVRLWDAGSGTALGPPLRGHKSRVWQVAFSVDGQRLVSASNDRTLAEWEVTAPSASARGHDGKIRCIALSPDGSTLVSGADDRSLRFWDMASRQPRGAPVLGHAKAVAGVAFSPDGRTVVSASEDGTLRLWDATTRQSRGDPLAGHSGPVWSVAFSPDGKTLASGGADASVRLWDVATGRARSDALSGHRGPVWSVAFSPDGTTVASAGEDGTLRLWDAAAGTPRGSALQGHVKRVWSMAFSPDGQRLASGGEDTTVRLWDVTTGRALGLPLLGHLQAVTSVAFSRDGQTLASGSDDTTLRFWDALTGQPRGGPLRGHEAALAALVFSADGRTLVSASEDKTLRWWAAPDAWVDRVCAKVVRNLSRLQWQQLVGDIGYVAQCPALPVPLD